MRSADLKQALPEYTCPDLNLVRDWLEQWHAPDDVIDALERARIANAQLRGVATDAIRSLRAIERRERRERK